MGWKKYLFNTCLLLLLLSAGFLTAYSLWDYQDNLSGPSGPGQNAAELTRQNPKPLSGPAQIQHAKPSVSQRMHTAQQPEKNTPPGSRPNHTQSQSGLSTALLVYAGGFLMLSLGAYYFFVHKKAKIDPGYEKMLLATLLCTGLLLRIWAATLMTGHSYDLSLFRSWAAAASNDFMHFYVNARSDYPPLYIYVLFVVGKLSSMPSLNIFTTLLLKLPSMLADMAVAYLIYRWAPQKISASVSLFLAAFYIFNPAVFINSTLWGQVDSFYTLLIVIAVYWLAKKRYAAAAVLFTAAVLMKPQGIIFLPLLGFVLLREKSAGVFLKPILAALLTASLIILPFAWGQDALWIFRLFAGTIGEYPYAAVNAFNLFALTGANFKSSAETFIILSYQSWGLIFISLITLYTGILCLKSKQVSIVPALALLQIVGVFTLACSMHERYMFPAAALALLAFILQPGREFLLAAFLSSISIFLNTYAILFATLQGVHIFSFGPVLSVTAILNIGLLIYLTWVLYKINSRQGRLPEPDHG